MQLGLFTDIHFQPQGLDRIIKTGDWIIEEFKRQGVKAVVCMGDALVTREEVDVVAQSAAINFFRKLADNWPVFLTLGNHDLNLKHSTSVSSLDGLDMHPKIKVFREITLVGDRFLFLPYHEDQSKIVQWIQDYVRVSPDKAKNVTVFGHLSINGAVQNTRYGTTFSGAIGPDTFSPFKATYSGHFHVHQKMDHRVTYVGSPLQFNFGDAGNERGVMILDCNTGLDRFILNPFHDAFKVISASDIVNQPEYCMESLEGCFVTVIYDDVVTEDQHDAIQKQLEACGVISVKKESVIDKAIREHTVDVEGVKVSGVVDLIEPFVKSVLSADSQLDVGATVAFGKAVINEVNANFQNVSDTGAVFEGDIVSITMSNFLGVKGTLTLDIAALAKGIWYFEGENGAGKSTILEAIYWCYFNETIRNDMTADDVIHDPDQTGKGKNCEVTVVHANGWSISRFRRNHAMGGTGVKVFKDGHYREDFEKGDPKATQAAICDLLGINAQTFSRAYIMGQNITANFITGDEKKRRAMLEEMLGLERFDAYLEKVREIKKTINDQLDQQESIQRIRAGEIERSATQVSSIDLQILDVEKRHQASIDSLAQRRIDHEQRIKAERIRITAVVDEAEKRSRVAEENWQAATTEHQAIHAEQANVEQAAKEEMALSAACAGTIARVQATVAARQTTLNKLELGRQRCIDALAANKAKLVQYEAGIALEPKVIAAYEKAKQIRENANAADHTAAEFRATAAALHAQASPLKAKAERLSRLTTGECPTCAHPVDKNGIDAIVAGLNTEVEQLRVKWSEATAAAKQSVDTADQLRKDADAVLAGCPTLEQMATIKAVCLEIKQTITNIQATVDAYPQQIQEAEEVFRRQLVVDVPGYHWSSTDLETVQQVLNKLFEDRAAHAAKATAIRAGVDTKRLEAVTAALAAAEQACVEATRAVRAASDERSAIEAGNAATVAAMDREATSLATTNPVKELQTTKERLIADRIKALDESEKAKEQAALLNKKSAYVVFWDRAFAAKGSMRAFLLEQSVIQFNTIVQSHISQHFGGKMTLTFNSDLTYKQRYGRRSGGQRKWTDLAALFAMFELTRQRSRYRAAWIGLDEVFDALDAKGRRAVLDLIASMASRVARIFVITHVDVAGTSRSGTIQAVYSDDAGTRLTVRPT